MKYLEGEQQRDLGEKPVLYNCDCYWITGLKMEYNYIEKETPLWRRLVHKYFENTIGI